MTTRAKAKHSHAQPSVARHGQGQLSAAEHSQTQPSKACAAKHTEAQPGVARRSQVQPIQLRTRAQKALAECCLSAGTRTERDTRANMGSLLMREVATTDSSAQNPTRG